MIPNEDDPINGQIQSAQSRRIPMNKSRRVISWKPDETTILTSFIGVSDKTTQQLFEEYQKECREKHIPDHPYNSFRKKLERIMKT